MHEAISKSNELPNLWDAFQTAWEKLVGFVERIANDLEASFDSALKKVVFKVLLQGGVVRIPINLVNGFYDIPEMGFEITLHTAVPAVRESGE